MILTITVLPVEEGFKVSGTMITSDENYVSSITVPELIVGDDWGGNPTFPTTLLTALVEMFDEYDTALIEAEEGETDDQ